MRALIVLAALLASAADSAHTRSESHSSWVVDGAAVHLNFSLSDREASRLSEDGTAPGEKAAIAYLGPLEGVTAGGAACPMPAPPHEVFAAPGYRRFEFAYECPSADGIVLRSAALFDLVLTHVNLAQVQTAKGDFVE